jgi:hypothetical protein
MYTRERIDDIYNPFDLIQVCSSCETSDTPFDFLEHFGSTLGAYPHPSSAHTPRPSASIYGEGIPANQGTTTPYSFSSSTNVYHSTTSWQQSSEKSSIPLPPHDAMHLSVVSLGSISGSLDDDAEETYRAGLIGDHGELRKPSFTPAMSLQQAMALAAEKEVGTSTSSNKALPRSSSNSRKELSNPSSLYSSGKSTTDIVLENLKQRTPTRKITTVSAMSAKEAAEKFKAKYGDPIAEKKRMKELANASTGSAKSSTNDSKQRPGWPKWNSDPIRGALAKPISAATERQSTTIRPKPRVIRLHSFV